MSFCWGWRRRPPRTALLGREIRRRVAGRASGPVDNLPLQLIADRLELFVPDVVIGNVFDARLGIVGHSVLLRSAAALASWFSLFRLLNRSNDAGQRSIPAMSLGRGPGSARREQSALPPLLFFQEAVILPKWASRPTNRAIIPAI